MLRSRYTIYVLALFGALAFSLPMVAQQTRVESLFDPPEVQAGERSNYIITLYGFRGGRIREALPQVPGLEQLSQQQSTHMQFDFKNAMLEHRYTFTMQTEKPGLYTMPAFTAMIDGNAVTIPAAELKVVATTTKTPNRDLWMDFELSAEDVYVGQTVLCHLNVYVAPQVRIEFTGPVEKRGDAFTDPPFSKINGKGTQTINGRNYTRYRLTATLTALKAGSHPLAFDFHVLAGLPQQRRLSNDPFDFFPESLFDQISLQEIKLKTQERTYTVQPLPKENQPSNFSGAIGQFSVSSHISDPNVAVGDPLSLTLELTGEGNFDRIQAPSLPLNEAQWKTYPPKTDFKPQDPIGYEGAKTFDYVLIPKSEELTAVPEISFSYFDPQTAEYVETELPPIALALEAGPPVPSSSRKAAVVDKTPATLGNTNTAKALGAGLLPILPTTPPLQSTSTLQPLFTSPLFLAGQLLPLSALAILYSFYRHQTRLRKDPAYARRLRGTRSIAHWRRQAHNAAAADDTPTFLKASQRAIQASIVTYARTLNDKPEALTFHDIETTLLPLEPEASLIDDISILFQDADTLKFAPRKSKKERDIDFSPQKLNMILKKLEKVLPK